MENVHLCFPSAHRCRVNVRQLKGRRFDRLNDRKVSGCSRDAIHALLFAHNDISAVLTSDAPLNYALRL